MWATADTSKVWLPFCPAGAGLSYQPHVLLCLTPPKKQPPSHMYLQLSYDVLKSQVPVKTQQDKLPWLSSYHEEVGQKWR